MTKKKYYHYVLVVTDDGPVFVTEVDSSTKTATWDMNKPPLELNVTKADDITLGLNMNMIPSYCVRSPFEIDRQPYRYDAYEMKFVEKDKEDNVSVE